MRSIFIGFFFIMVTYKIREGMGIIEFNDPDSPVNALSYRNMGLLKSIIDDIVINNRGIEGLFFISGKEDMFIAGADIKELADIKSKEEALELCRRGQNLFNVIEKLNVPTVAIIDGPCVGGGLELALSCDYIVSTANKRIKLGLPETKLGIAPGFGGPHRLEERIGPKRAGSILKTGVLLNHKEASRMKIIDKIIPESAKTHYKSILRDFSNPGVFRRNAISGKDKVRIALEEREREAVAEMIVKEPARNALSSYVLVNKYRTYPWQEADAGDAVYMKNSLVIGAGTMGRGIAYLISSQSDDISLDVRDSNKAVLGAAKKDIEGIYKDAVRRGLLRVGTARSRLNKISFDSTGIEDKDLIIEAVTEKEDVKKGVFEEIEKRVGRDCIIATNTSCISIRELASSLEYPERFIGMHFFNPAYKMKLVEVVPSQKTSRSTIRAVIDFLRRLKRIPVVVKDSPGFLVNRMLLPYLNEAVFMLEEGFSGRRLERAMLDFGMPMGPFELIETIGQEVAYKASKILEYNFGPRMKVPESLRNPRLKGVRWFRDKKSHYGEDFITERLLRPIRKEAELCLEEGVARSREAVDLALLLGIGFPIKKRIWLN